MSFLPNAPRFVATSDLGEEHAHLPDLLQQSVEQFRVSTETTNVDLLLASEASRHFPEPRNRRREDTRAEEIRRLRAALQALDEGATFSDDMLDGANAPVHSEFYRQF